MACRGPSLFFRTVVPPFLSFLLPALFSASRVFPLSDAGLPSAAFHAHSFPGGFFSLFLFFRLRSVWRFRLPGPFSLRLFPHFARSASGFFPSLFGLALPASRSVFVTSFPAFRPIRLRLFSVFVRFGASGFPFRFRYVFSRISPDPPPAIFRLCSVWRFRLPGPFSLRLFPHFARSASGYFPSSFGLALPVSGFRLRLVLSRIIRLHVWRYVSRRGLRGTTMPTAQAVPVAHAAASADRAEPENRPERPLPSGSKLRAAVASVLPSGGRIPVVLLASGASVCRLRQERRRQSGMVRFQRLKAVP